VSSHQIHPGTPEQGYKAARQPSNLLRTWLGDIRTELHTPDYNEWRKELSSSAYYGFWDRVFDILDIGIQQFGESWVNAVRVSKLIDTYIVSRVSNSN
jgi:hypothetical protein